MAKKAANPGKVNWRRSQVIEAAAHCFMEKGFQATTIDDVAAHLGCSKGRIYHYSATKTDLFFEVHREGMARLFSARDAAMSQTGDGLSVLQGMLLAHANAMLEHATFETVVAQGVQLHRFLKTTPEQREELNQLIASRDEFESGFKAQIKAGIADKSIRRCDVSITAKTLLGGLQWSIYWYRARPDETAADRRKLARKMVEPLIEGMRGAADTRPA